MPTNTSTILAALLLSLTTLPANDQADLDALRSKAARGDAKAQRTLAFRYRDGTGVAKDDAEALRWAHRAADGGDAEAMDLVGFAYLRGAVVKRNPEIAIGYFRAAADESAQAAFNLVNATTVPRARRRTACRRLNGGKKRRARDMAARPRVRRWRITPVKAFRAMR